MDVLIPAQLRTGALDRTAPAAGPAEGWLELISDALPALVAYVDAAHTYRFVNRAYERWFGLSRGDVVGRHLRDVLGEAAYLDLLPRILATLGGQEVVFQTAVPYARGGHRVVEATYVPDRGEDGVRGYIALVQDVTERHRLEEVRQRSDRRTERLLSITAAIADAVTLEQVVATVSHQVCEAIYASTTGLWLFREDTQSLELQHSIGYGPAAVEAVRHLPLEPGGRVPAVDALRTGQPLWFTSQAALLERYPHLEPLVTRGRNYQVAALPVLGQARTIGALGLTFDRGPPLDEEEQSFLVLVARYCGQALERALLLESERESRRRAEAAASRLATLNQASRAFAAAGPTGGSVLQAVVEQITASHAEVCSILLLSADGELLEPAALHHRAPGGTDVLAALYGSAPLRRDLGATGRALETGAPVLVPHFELPEPLRAALTPEQLAWLEANHPTSVIAAPLRARDRILGALTVVRLEPSPPFTEDDLRLMEELADRAALAIDAGLLYDADRMARERAEAARRSTELLHQLAARVMEAQAVEEVYAAALDILERALGARRSAILLHDDRRVMRFRAARGLSADYQRAVEGHSPWSPDDRTFTPVVVEDAAADPHLAPFLDLLRQEEIAALGFFPLLQSGRLIGKFMAYYEAPRSFSQQEIEMAAAIAHHVASGVARFSAMARERANAKALEAAALRVAQLQQATSRLASALTAQQVADILLEVAEEVMEAPAGVVYATGEDGALHLIAARGAPGVAERWPTVGDHARLPLTTAIERRAAVWIERFEDFAAAYPHLASGPRLPANREAMVALPLIHAGRVVGGFALGFASGRTFDAPTKQWLESLASQCALALERARLYEAEQTARGEAETLLRIASSLTSAQLDLDALVQRLTNEATALSGAAFGACFYNAGGSAGASYQLHSLSGVTEEAFVRVGPPRVTPLFETTFSGAGVVRLDDVRADPRYGAAAPHHGVPPGHPQVASYLAVPVIARSGEVIGGLFFGHPEPGRFTEQHEKLVEAVAANAAVSIDNARLLRSAWEAEEAQTRRARQAALAADVGATFTEGGPLAALLQRCCTLAVERLDFALARIWEPSADGARLELGAESGRASPPDEARSIAPGNTRVGRAAASRAPFFATDLPKRPELADPAWAAREGIASVAVYPLVLEDKLLGVMELFARRPIHQDTFEALGAVARTIAIGVQRSLVEAERERLVSELERTLHFNEMFAGILGHDLRNPLGAMMTAAQLVLRRTDDEKTTKPLRRILSSGERMARMIDQILDFTRARIGGGLPVDAKEIDLREVVKQTLEEVELAHPGWSFAPELLGDSAGTWDRDRLCQVFSNLVWNAVQHGSPHAPLRFRVDGRRPEAVEIEIRNAGSIPAELLPVLFDPFRGAQHKRDGTQGLGLGLFITQQIVRAHGGDITVTSSEEAGTTFHIVLPRQLPQEDPR